MLTMCALDDLAAKLNMDPVEFFGKNLNLTKRERIRTVKNSASLQR